MMGRMTTNTRTDEYTARIADALVGLSEADIRQVVADLPDETVAALLLVLTPDPIDLDEEFLKLLDGATPEEITKLVEGLPADVVDTLLASLGR